MLIYIFNARFIHCDFEIISEGSFLVIFASSVPPLVITLSPRSGNDIQPYSNCLLDSVPCLYLHINTEYQTSTNRNLISLHIYISANYIGSCQGKDNYEPNINIYCKRKVKYNVIKIDYKRIPSLYYLTVLNILI